LTDVPENCVAGKTIFSGELENHAKPVSGMPWKLIDWIIWIAMRRKLKNSHQEVQRVKDCGGPAELLGTTGRIEV
jgi:hypothetical protein